MVRFCVVLLVLMFFLSSCNNDDSPPDCGCYSEPWTTVTDVVGTLSYKIQIDPLDDFYNDKFVLGITFSDCGNCSQGFVVCNEKMLEDYKYL